MYRQPTPSAAATGSGSAGFDLGFTVDLATRMVTGANARAQQALGIAGLPASIESILDTDDLDLLDHLHPTISAGSPWSGRLRLRLTALGQREIQTVIVTDPSPDNRGSSLSILASEVTRPDQVLADLAHRATHDPLTGLPNRALLLDRLGLALARSRRTEQPVALLFIDLDNFKQINDTKGHSAGDRTLVEAAQTMALALRPSDTIARMGGDEFVVLCGEISDAADAETIAERVRDQLRTQTNPYTRSPLTASIGVVVAAQGDTDATSLLAAADRAMYDAKSQGFGHITLRILGGSDVEISPAPGPEAVRKALYAGELVISATPVIDLRTGFVAQVEVRPTWIGYSGSPYVATEFVSPSIDPTLAHQLDVWSLQASFNTHRFFAVECGPRAPRVTTNISSATTVDTELVRLINGLVGTDDGAGAGWNALGLEFDEDAVPVAGNASVHVLDELDALGVALAIDDFGSGSLPLAWLARGTVRSAKIAGTLTAEIGRSSLAKNAFGAAVATAHGLGLAAVAMDVATHEQLEHALYLGCDAAQGPLFSTNDDPVDLMPVIEGRYPVDFW